MSWSKETINAYIKKQRKCILHLWAPLKRELLFGVIQKCNKTLKPGEWREFRAPRREKKERLGGCWMNAFHIILVGRWCSCVSFRRSELCCQSFFDFFWSGINDKTQDWQRSWGNVAYYRLPLARVSALFHIHRCGPVCVFPPVSCFIQKDHYQLCLAEINWITTTWVDVFSFHPAPR